MNARAVKGRRVERVILTTSSFLIRSRHIYDCLGVFWEDYWKGYIFIGKRDDHYLIVILSFFLCFFLCCQQSYELSYDRSFSQDRFGWFLIVVFLFFTFDVNKAIMDVSSVFLFSHLKVLMEHIYTQRQTHYTPNVVRMGKNLWKIRPGVLPK